MRNIGVLLKGLEDIKVLLQYLYIDVDNYVDYTYINHLKGNKFSLRLSLNEEGRYQCIDMTFDDEKYRHNYKDLPQKVVVDWTVRMTLDTMLGIIEQQKELPASDKYFKNKWEEIKGIVTSTCIDNKVTKNVRHRKARYCLYN